MARTSPGSNQEARAFQSLRAAARRVAPGVKRVDMDELVQDTAVAMARKGVPPEEWARAAPAFLRRTAANLRRRMKLREQEQSGDDASQKAGVDPHGALEARELLSDRFRAFARRRFERSTRLRWTPLIEATFRGWIPAAPVNYTEWNAQASMAQTLVKAILDAQRWLATHPDRGGIAHTIERVADALPMLRFFAKRRRSSADVWLIRYIDISTFLGLRRPPTLVELTSISILLNHGVAPKENETPSAYFNRHQKRIRALREDHPKGSRTADEYERQCREAGVEPVDWPPTEPAEETEV